MSAKDRPGRTKTAVAHLPCRAMLVAATLAVDAVVGQVDETVGKTLSVVPVGLRRQPTKPFLMHVHPAVSPAPGKKYGWVCAQRGMKGRIRSTSWLRARLAKRCSARSCFLSGALRPFRQRYFSFKRLDWTGYKGGKNSSCKRCTNNTHIVDRPYIRTHDSKSQTTRK